jgi:hypothetical protein
MAEEFTEMTTVLLSSKQKTAVKAKAKDAGVSQAAVIRWAIDDWLERQAKAAGLMVRAGQGSE